MAPLTRLRSLLLVATAVTATAVLAGPASAQARGSLELVAQSSWVDDGGVFDLQVRVAGADSDETVVIKVHRPVQSRTSFLAGDTIAQEPLLTIGPTPLSELQTTSNEILAIQIAIVGPDTSEPEPLDEEEDAIPVLRTDGESGVYPVEIVLQDSSGDVADSFVTHIIELPRSSAIRPLRVAVVVPVEMPIGLTEDGFYALADDAGSKLANLIEAMEINPDTSVALDIAPESLAALERSSAPLHTEITAALAEVIGPEEVLATSYVRLEEQAWINAELGDELADLYAEAAAAVQSVIGEAPDTSVAIVDESLGSGGLDWLVDQGVQGVLVRSDQLQPLDGDIFNRTLNRTFVIPTDSGGTVPALEIDRFLSRHFVETGSPVLDANLMLADLSLLALDDPALRRSVIVHAPPDWDPNLAFLNVLLGGIDRIPNIASATPKQAIAQSEFAPAEGDGTISPPLRRALLPVDPEPLGPFRTAYNQAVSAVRSWGTVVAADDATSDRFMELLRVASDQSHTTATRNAYISTIYRLIDEQKNTALLTPPAETITITSRKTTVPIALENRLSVDLQVVLRFDSEKLAFPEGKEIARVLTPGQNRIDVPIEALASGDAPLRVQILSPDREVLLGSSQVLIRTIAFSNVGLFIGIAAMIILVLWWLRSLRSHRGNLQAAPVEPERPAVPELTR